jgi:membrane associated rhomboid family serine protease
MRMMTERSATMSIVPARDISRPVSTFPVATASIVALNVVMFLIELAAGTSFVDRYAAKPYEITHGHQLETLFTSMFMHASLIHIAGNMVFLVAFGQGLEANYLGSLRFVGFYLLCGLAAAAAQIAVDPNSTVSFLGASGAIAGVMGGYLVVFPDSQIMATLVTPIGLIPTRITAGIFIAIWFVIQLISGFGSIGGAGDSGVAYFAHIGGFIAGALLILLFGAGEREAAT